MLTPQLGYSVRDAFADFVKRYKTIAFGYHDTVPGTKESCETILEASGIKNWQLGKDKVFLKYYHGDQLSALVRKRRRALLFVENVCRGHIARVR